MSERLQAENTVQTITEVRPLDYLPKITSLAEAFGVVVTIRQTTPGGHFAYGREHFGITFGIVPPGHVLLEFKYPSQAPIHRFLEHLDN